MTSQFFTSSMIPIFKWTNLQRFLPKNAKYYILEESRETNRQTRESPEKPTIFNSLVARHESVDKVGVGVRILSWNK